MLAPLTYYTLLIGGIHVVLRSQPGTLDFSCSLTLPKDRASKQIEKHLKLYKGEKMR